MKELLETIQQESLTYITRDIERALGLGLDIQGYTIISNATPFAKAMQQQAKRTQIVLIEESTLLDTWELCEHPLTHHILATCPKKNIVVFKPTEQIERLATQYEWHLLNPSATLAKQCEEKISQVTWLGELERYLPPHKILACKDIAWNYEPFILQFNRTHTGTGTLFVDSKEGLERIQKQFPNRPARVTQYIDGHMYTNNTIVASDDIFLGNISHQITGLAPFTENRFATIGNDWELPVTSLSYDAKALFQEIAHAVGKRLKASGWRGAFGIDVMVEKNTGQVYLIEINARQPASVTYESVLQEKRKTRDNSMTTFEAHLSALFGIPLEQKKIIPLETGAQIILRVSNTTQWDVPGIQATLQSDGRLTTIPYVTQEVGADLLRIQSRTGLLQTPDTYTEVGTYCKNTIDAHTV